MTDEYDSDLRSIQEARRLAEVGMYPERRSRVNPWLAMRHRRR